MESFSTSDVNHLPTTNQPPNGCLVLIEGFSPQFSKNTHETIVECVFLIASCYWLIGEGVAPVRAQEKRFKQHAWTISYEIVSCLR